jgi:hypothetical protein
MNENQPMTEKDFPKLMGRIKELDAARAKNITEIDNILDKIKANRPPQTKDGGAKEDGMIKVNAFVNDLYGHIIEMETDHAKLSLIIARLNELI